VFRHVSGEPIRVGFYLDERFSTIPFISAVEILRIANRVTDRCLFEWAVLSADGQPVRANNGMEFKADAGVGNVPKLHNVVVISGNDPQRTVPAPVARWLRHLAAQGSTLAAFGSGSLLLAQAGLLDGYRATIHWEFLDGFREDYPNVDVSNNLYEIDRGRITCAGGSAVVDLGLHLLHEHFGAPVAMAVSDQFILDHVRTSTYLQPVGSRKSRVAHPVLAKVIDIMERNLEHPIPLSDVSSSVGVTEKQIQRLFRTYLHTSPRQYYVRARLRLARRLLTQTDKPITEVALSSGFGSLAHFSRSYRDEFGLPPTKDRHRCRLETGTVSHTHVHKICGPDLRLPSMRRPAPGARRCSSSEEKIVDT